MTATAVIGDVGGIATRRLARMEKLIATTAECLEMPAAIALVKGCLGGNLFPLDTKLGDIYPDRDARMRFCQCVADGASVGRSTIPCGAGNTVGEVIDAIAC